MVIVKLDSSVAVAEIIVTDVEVPVASAVMSDGAVITGGVVSTTFTVLVTWIASFPDESTELYVTE